MTDDEVLISVDIEASGPTPSTGSLVSIGACPVNDPGNGLYLELKPLPDRPWSDEAERVHHLSREHLAARGVEPAEAMATFDAWLLGAADGRRPVFVAFNATFDWMFVADYFHRFLGRNPFGVSGLDIKAYGMGRLGLARWDETRLEQMTRRLGLRAPHAHHALEDAREQAEVFIRLKGIDA